MILITTLNSCASDFRGFEFENFKDTPLSELAIAVKNNDAEDIKRILNNSKLNLDYKEPIYEQTLLTLAIVNQKKEAFLELLIFGANPNEIIGKELNSSALTEAIKHQKGTNFFYIESLLKNGANPNLEIIPNNNSYFPDYYPLFTAIYTTGDNEDKIDSIELLVKYGANINCCSPKPSDYRMCEGVISKCLDANNMKKLHYFVVIMKIKIPKIAYILGSIEETNQEVFTLTEILKTKQFSYYDFVQDGEKVDRSSDRIIRNQILDYLKETKQE